MLVTTIVGAAPHVKEATAAERIDRLAPWLHEGAPPGVAPQPLERVRALVNTDDRFHGVDTLAGAPDAFVAARTALRGLVVSGDAAGLSELAAPHPLTVALDARAGLVGTRLVPAPGGDGETDAVAGLLAVVHAAVAAGTWERLKECSNPDCRWIFYDGSRNRSGRWCAMGECGDVMKARVYRERHRRTPSAGGA